MRRRPGPPPRRAVVAGGAVALLLLGAVVVSAVGSGGTAEACADQHLRYGADVQAEDQRAVDAARLALAAGTSRTPEATPRAPAATASRAPAKPPATTAAQPVSSPVAGPSASELRAAESAVAVDEREVASAQDEYDRVVAEQQAADDPGQYDEQVVGAEESLSVARAQLADDRRVLAALREQARRAEASRQAQSKTPPAPSPSKAATVTRAPVTTASPEPAREVLEQRLADAQAVQAEHLAARRTELEQAREKGCPVG